MSLDVIHRLSTDHCPSCNTELDSVSSINTDEKPEPGSITVCIECAEILEFNNDLHLVKLSPLTLDSFDQDLFDQVIALRKLIIASKEDNDKT